MRPIRFPEFMMTWPSVTVEFELAPWHWELWFWHDWPLSATWKAHLGPVRLEFSGNRPLFSKES